MIRWRLFLTPWASVCMTYRSNGSTRNFLSYYLFGVRVAHLHLDR